MKVKKCPFCYDAVSESRIVCVKTTKGNYKIQCEVCGSASGFCGTKEGAIAAWNSREESAALIAMLKRLVRWLNTETPAECDDNSNLLEICLAAEELLKVTA